MLSRRQLSQVVPRVATTVAVLSGLADEVRAQSTGTVRAAVTTATGLPLGGARVALHMAGARVPLGEVEEAGAYMATRVPAGDGWLVARRIGYRPDSLRVQIGAGATLSASLPLQQVAVELDAVRVVGRRDMVGHLAGFYRRMDMGHGRFFTASELERRNAVNMTDVFRMVPGLRIETRSGGFQNAVRMRGSRCAPLVWLDGQPLYAGEVDLDAFDPRSFDGIEIYSGPSSVPVEFQGNQRMSSACGTIVLWSKRGEPRERRRRKQELTPAERLVAMVEKGEAFVAADVDTPAQPDSLARVRPVYPDSLFETMTPGRVTVEFVVTSDGSPDMDTFSAVTTTHRLFVEPVRRAVREQRFTPAVRRGRVVPQVVLLPFEFTPDSTARRRR